MAIPTLSKITSINYLFIGQPYETSIAVAAGTLATTGTIWKAESLPTGITIDATTGRISGTPTKVGAMNARIAARGSGASDWSAWLLVPFGVMSAPQQDVTEGATVLVYDLNTEIVYNPVASQDVALRLTAGTKTLIAFRLQEGDVNRRLPYLGLIEAWLRRDPDEPGVKVIDMQPGIRGSDGAWSYQVILDLTDPAVAELVETNLIGQDLVAALLLQVKLNWYPIVDNDPNTTLPLSRASMPMNVHVAKAPDA